MTVAGSIVIIPPLIISSIFGITWSIFSCVSTAMTITGRSRDISAESFPRRRLRAPYPAIPRMTVAPENPSFRNNLTSASYRRSSPYLSPSPIQIRIRTFSPTSFVMEKAPR